MFNVTDDAVSPLRIPPGRQGRSGPGLPAPPLRVDERTSPVPPRFTLVVHAVLEKKVAWRWGHRLQWCSRWAGGWCGRNRVFLETPDGTNAAAEREPGHD